MSAAVLEPPPGEVPHAVPTPVSEPYWAAAARGVLLYQVCGFCETVNAPPTEVCRDCQLATLRWEESAGLATLYSWTVVHRPVTPAFAVPYAPAIVELDEGFSVVTNLIGLVPDQIEADMRLRVEFRRVSSDLHLPYFRPR